MNWFRMYSEFATDPKVQILDETFQRRLIMLLCLRCNSNVTLHETHISFQLRITEQQWKETKAVFIANGFIDENNKILNWDKRQYIGDHSYERVKRHRLKRGAKGLPQQNYISNVTRNAVFELDNGICVFCGSKDDLTIDHNLPLSRGGGNETDNLITACRACNASKRDLTHDEYCERNNIVTLLKRPHIQKQNTDTEKKEDKKNKSKKKLKAERIELFAWEENNGVLSVSMFEDWIKQKELDTEKIRDELEHFRGKCAANLYKYADFAQAFQNWVREEKYGNGIEKFKIGGRHANTGTNQQNAVTNGGITTTRGKPSQLDIAKQAFLGSLGGDAPGIVPGANAREAG